MQKCSPHTSNAIIMPTTTHNLIIAFFETSSPVSTLLELNIYRRISCSFDNEQKQEIHTHIFHRKTVHMKYVVDAN